MAFPFLGSSSRKKRTQVMAVDLGSRTSKAVLLERRGEVLTLCRYALLDAPIYEKKFSAEMLSDHLRSVTEALGNPTKLITLALGLDDAVVRQVQLPQIQVSEMRMVLKNNSKAYMQQDLPNYVFDCYIFPPRYENGKLVVSPKSTGIPKLKVLAAGAKQSAMNDFEMAIKNAGLTPDCIVPGLVGPANAFELALPQVFANDSVALVDIGFKQTSICILDRGELALSRVVNIGGDKLTTGLAEAMKITYADAEGAKVGMSPDAKSAIEAQVMPLGRELRASLDFFEHQEDRPVSQVYISGGTARSEMILQMLHNEMIVECKTWNATSFLQMALPAQQTVEIDHVGPQLTVAVGAALAAF
jgi:type IV pilus assembly protein PilM